MFIFDNIPVITCLVKSVFFIRHGWAEMNRELPQNFVSNWFVTETLVLVQKAYRNEAVNRSKVFRRYSRFRDGKELVEDDERGGRPKLT